LGLTAGSSTSAPSRGRANREIRHAGPTAENLNAIFPAYGQQSEAHLAIEQVIKDTTFEINGGANLLAGHPLLSGLSDQQPF